MFWFKKKESKVEKLLKEKEEYLKSKNVMFDRLSSLFENISCVQDIKSDIFHIKCTHNAIIRQEYIVSVKTALGWRNYSISREYGMWTTDFKEFELSLTDIFEVSALKSSISNEVYVKPLLGEVLKAEDIDLAILELENIFKGYADEHDKKLKIHYGEVKKLKKGN